MTRFILIVVLFVLLPSRGMFMQVETTPIPVERVLTNLNKRLASDTNNFELLHVIARLHSLSYSRAASNWLVNVVTNSARTNSRFSRSDRAGMPFLGYGPGFPPDSVAKPTNSTNTAAAKRHLDQAIDFYKRAAAVNPTNAIPHIGLGWCLVQAGRTNEAKNALRRAVDLSWQREKNSKFLMWAVTPEAITYLTPLLHPQRDSIELQRLKTIQADPVWNRRVVTPLILPLQPNVAFPSLINTNASIPFDLDGSGIPNRNWQWITTNAAWIVHLPQGGPVTSALQMFGNVTFWMFWENGYHALASLDDNADGLLSGDELRGIRLWYDRNSDGICDPNEILELTQLGLTALDTRYTNQNQLLTSPAGARFRDGSTRPTYDIFLQRAPSP